MLLQQLKKKKLCKFLCHYSYYSRNLLVCIHTLVDNLCNAQNSLIKYDFFSPIYLLSKYEIGYLW